MPKPAKSGCPVISRERCAHLSLRLNPDMLQTNPLQSVHRETLMSIIARCTFVGLLVCTSWTASAQAQSNAPPLAQALAEMKADVQGRADRQIYPIAGIKADDVR